MRQIIINGHRRAVTMVKYNKEGDLIFSVAKDSDPTVWDGLTGQRLGHYEGHKGAVWACDVNNASTMFATAGADQMLKIFKVETGECIASIEHTTPVRGVQFAHGDRQIMSIQDKSFGQKPCIKIFNLGKSIEDIQGWSGAYNPCSVYEVDGSAKINHAVWGPTNNHIYFGSEDGTVSVLDVEKQKEVVVSFVHNDRDVKRLCWDTDYTMIASAGIDNRACLLDARDCKIVQTYKNDFPVNDVAVIPHDVMNQVIIGGGLDAQSITNVGSARNKFDMRFMHKIFGEELGSTAGHFGPVHSLAAEPNGRGFLSGGEDGTVRLHHFDPDYYSGPGKPGDFFD